MFPSAIEVLVGEHDVTDSVPATRIKVCYLIVYYFYVTFHWDIDLVEPHVLLFQH